MTPPSHSKRCLFIGILILGPYLLVEGAVSTYAWFSWLDTSLNLLEDSGDAIQFDSARGYRLNRTLARQVRIINGRVEHVSMFRGNAEGFPGRQEFGRTRPAPGVARVAVFGDSFSHEPFLGQNWPDRVEDLARSRGQRVQLLNFSLCAIGLANWWSILTKVVEAEEYELDGVVFAVYEGDLVRRFMVEAMPPSPGRYLLCGRCPSWDPRTYPATVEDAQPYLTEYVEQHLVSRAEFEGALQGHWPASVPHRFQPVILRRIWHLVRALRTVVPPCPETPGDFEPERKRLVEDLRRILTARALPVLVVHIPSRETLLHPDAASALYREKCKTFATALGATFIDGADVFAGMKAVDIRAQFYPHDGHWNQQGSDRFAEFMVNHLDVFAAASQTPGAGGTAPSSPPPASKDEARAGDNRRD
jgi:hypothetical protein